MKKQSFRRHFATFLQKVPMVMKVGHPIVRFLQPKFTVGAVGVVIDDEGRLLLVEHVFHPHYPWGLPGGWINPSENPAECVKREIMEELQLEVTIERLLLVQQTFPRHMDFAYLCRAKGTIGILSNELLDYAWYHPTQVPNLLNFHRQAVQEFLNSISDV